MKYSLRLDYHHYYYWQAIENIFLMGKECMIG